MTQIPAPFSGRFPDTTGNPNQKTDPPVDSAKLTDTLHQIERSINTLSPSAQGLIARKIVIDNTTNTITFENIPKNYYNLRLLMSVRNADLTASARDVFLNFNSDVGANYEWIVTQNINGVVAGASALGATTIRIGRCPTNFVGLAPGYSGSIEVVVYNYRQLDFYTSVTGANQWSDPIAGQTTTENFGGAWRNTVAVNRIDITLEANHFVKGSKVTLYGMA